MKPVMIFLAALCLSVSLQAQQLEISQPRKAVRTSGDVGAVLLPVAGLTAILIEKDWQGLKQGALAGITTLGVTYALKYAVKKERPDHSDNHSFPSMHTSVSFTAASFIQRRYGWKWGLPAYVVSTYVGWSRVYGKKHDWWDVAAGAAIGVGSSYLFTRPFAKKHDLAISPVVGDGYCGFYTSLKF
ncbi:phosphatase PAP2 family protein [Phocaeicola plebeius]|uniref:phosphatase PAP2 family protein n=1 Tax=Phocaeicola plebeius TaxID=310297 RepID=UPI003AB601DE